MSDVRIPDENHPLNKLDFEPVLKYIPEKCSLLDVGCGKGTWLRFLRKHRPDVKAIGIDVNPEYDRKCREDKLNVMLGNIETLILPNLSYDIVTCFHVLEHLENDRNILLKLIKIAKFRVILILPRFFYSFEHLQTAFKEHYIPFYTPLTLKRLLKGLNAKVEEHYKPTGKPESWLVVIDV